MPIWFESLWLKNLATQGKGQRGYEKLIKVQSQEKLEETVGAGEGIRTLGFNFGKVVTLGI